MGGDSRKPPARRAPAKKDEPVEAIIVEKPPVLPGATNRAPVIITSDRVHDATARRAQDWPKTSTLLIYTAAGIGGFALVALVIVAIANFDRIPQQQSGGTPSTSAATPATWYSGGTLHRKSALEWQTASSKDKLGTCADFVAGMWQNGDLRPAISNNLSTVDDVRPYAQELVDFLDAAFKPDPDPEQNRILFTNQEVAYTASMGMVTMGWTRQSGRPR